MFETTIRFKFVNNFPKYNNNNHMRKQLRKLYTIDKNLGRCGSFGFVAI